MRCKRNIYSYMLLLAAVGICFLCGSFLISVYADDDSCITGGGMAVTGQAENMGYAAKLYNADSGLPTSEANAVLSSSDGFIWIGGYSGLIRYDGTNFERQDSSGGITNVNALFEDSKGRLWVGTNDNGVVCLYKDHSEHYSYSDGLGSASIDCFAEDTSGNIIVGTKIGIYYFDQGMNIRPISDSQIRESFIMQLASDGEGAVCGVTKDGAVFRIKDLRVTDYYNGDDIGTSTLTSVMPSPEKAGEVWLGSEQGTVFRGSFEDYFRSLESYPLIYTPDDEVTDTETEAVFSEPVPFIYFASGRIWAITSSKVFYTDENGVFTQLEDIPLNGGIENMTEDWEGNLWFASRRQGVMKIAANKFFVLTEHAHIEQRIVNSTCKHQGNIYIGTDTGLQIVDRDNKPVSNDLSEYLGNTRIRCMTEDKNGDLWVSTFTNSLGLVCYTSEGDILSFTEDDGLPSKQVRCTAAAADGSVLVGTNGGLAVIRDRKIVKVTDSDKGLVNTVLLTVEATDDGRYYLGTDGDGIYVADGNNLTHLSHEDGLTSDVILRIKHDEERNVIWVITSNSIEYIKDGKIKPVKSFPYTNNYDIYFDSRGNAWVLASNGIYVANAEDMIEKDNFDYVFYNVANGLSCVPTANSFSYLDDNGDLYISGRSGVSRVNIDSYFSQRQDIRFSVLYIEDDNNRYYPDDSNNFVIPSTADNITIYGYALSYMLNDPQIQYILDGADTKPITLNKSAMGPVRYTNLSGGNYEFRLSLIDGATHTVKQTESFRIVKQKAFYEQLWFYMLCAAGLLIVAALFIWIYLKRKTAIFSQKEEEQRRTQRLFEQTVTSLVNAVDAKDKYTHGHSARVAEYSRKLAEMVGKSENECNEIYYSALLHDVGKIGVPEYIINKKGRLDDEEFEKIKEHPSMGAQILQSISEYPFLAMGAHFHHERYDGKGYPLHLKGTDIPEIARIVSVADAYDAMTSKRSYRDPIPQQKVREEIVKGSGTQFDPVFAKLMLHLIDLDTEYTMKEREEIKELSGKSELIIGRHRSVVSEGISITPFMTTIYMEVRPEGGEPAPSIVLFDSLDARVHTDNKRIIDLSFFEFGEIGFNGKTVTAGARKMETISVKKASKELNSPNEYKIEAIKIKDHVLVRIIGNSHTTETITALPDSSRFVYIGLTGEHCRISNVRIERSEEITPTNYIPRIAEEVSYINVPYGDIPNVQIDGYRTDASNGIAITDGMKISFRTRSLPNARLVWHCPYIDIFTSDDGKVKGKNYRDLAFMRIDGESWSCDDDCKVEALTEKSNDFKGWDEWKLTNKEGYDCTVTFEYKDNKINMYTENSGIIIKFSAELHDVRGTIYAAITGDQTAVTNIRITK
ncbi:HD domain-containing phosphohydrolase [uncultured Ruminococcus sp.]|uniref:HD domain-containing phosphohydrolase n=1 Tax=uncultured Ruminococcus sp. TaxID=165186 RepID=UPI0025E51464|nr:HD domain-containing phosphohydrolase [uncultured Ruminococcus sp.]